MNKPFIVAEIGANHNGRLNHSLNLVEAAARAGADAIKIQTWMPGTMCLDANYKTRWRGQDVGLADLYREAELPWAWHKPIFEHARKCGLTPFSSPFDKESVDFLEREVDCPIYKIASFELVDLPLIRYVAALEKPMILSCGMATRSEIRDAYVAAGRTHDVTMLKCTSAYPSDAGQANLATMQDIRRICADGVDVGLSDHTPGIGVAVAAAALGASVIEKHFCLSRADGGLDAAFSLEPAEFASMCVECRRAAAAIGQVRYGPSPGESTSLRRSLYFARDMAAGEVIKPADLVTARPALGLSPSNYEKLTGGYVRVIDPVKRGQPVTATCFAPDVPIDMGAMVR